MKRTLALLVLAAGCRSSQPEAAPTTGFTAPPSSPMEAAPADASLGAPRLPDLPQPEQEPSYPELDYLPSGPTKDDGLASSGVPGYKRAGCDPLGPYEDEYLHAPGYDLTACMGYKRMANVVVGQIDGPGGSSLNSKPARIRCWPLSDKEKARSTYSSALAELTACPKQRGGHGVQLPEDAPLSAGTCSDGRRFLREGYLLKYRTRFYDGETLNGIRLFRGVGKGGDCRGEVNCDVVQEEGLCGTTPDQPQNYAPQHLGNPSHAPLAINKGGSGAASGRSTPDCPGPLYLRVRNASLMDFDAAEVDRIQFGPVRSGAVSEYKQAAGCHYSYGAMNATSGKQRFVVFPIDFVGETPLRPGYYTHALTTEPSSDPQIPGGLSSRISRDRGPQ
jgi:hypothetical protein